MEICHRSTCGELVNEDHPIYTAWWLTYPTPLKNDGVKVSWDDYSIPNMMGKS